MSQFNFNDVIEWGALNETEREEILRRPAVMAGDRIKTVVEGILEAVRERGDEALREFSAKFDRTEVKDFRVSAEEVDAAVARLPEDFMAAPPPTSRSSTAPKCLSPSRSRRCPASSASRSRVRSARWASTFPAARLRSFPRC